MKIIVAHNSPDPDAIISTWLIKRFQAGWQEAKIRYVPAGSRLKSAGIAAKSQKLEDAIEIVGDNEIIHVDTGLGPLDHHQTSDDNVSAASLALEFVLLKNHDIKNDKLEALKRMVKIVVDDDHFKDVFWPDGAADYHDFDFRNIIDGLKLERPDDDDYYMDFGMVCLDALLHQFENKVWAENEIKEKGIEFESVWGKGLGIESINDSIIKLAQLIGYVLVVRRDPRKGYVRIKATPKVPEIDLTNVYNQLQKMDPQATWFLHVSKKMLLNGTSKNPNMRPTTLSLSAIISVIKK